MIALPHARTFRQLSYPERTTWLRVLSGMEGTLGADLVQRIRCSWLETERCG